MTDLSIFKVTIQDSINSSRNYRPDSIIWHFMSLFRITSGINRIQRASPTLSKQIRRVPGNTGDLANTQGPTKNAIQSSSRTIASHSGVSSSRITSGALNYLRNIGSRTAIRHRNESQTNNESENPNKWILLGLPKDGFKIVEHIDVTTLQNDVGIFREIRKEYEFHRKLKRRFLELYDVHKVHLVKVSFVVSSN